MVVFRNYQWGAEKRNTTLWYDNNFVGTELNPDLSYARVAEGCGLKGVQAATMEELSGAIREGCAAQADGVTTFVEVLLNQELGEPFPPGRHEETRGGRRHRLQRHADAGGSGLIRRQDLPLPTGGRNVGPADVNLTQTSGSLPPAQRRSAQATKVPREFGAVRYLAPVRAETRVP